MIDLLSYDLVSSQTFTNSKLNVGKYPIHGATYHHLMWSTSHFSGLSTVILIVSSCYLFWTRQFWTPGPLWGGVFIVSTWAKCDRGRGEEKKEANKIPQVCSYPGTPRNALFLRQPSCWVLGGFQLPKKIGRSLAFQDRNQKNHTTNDTFMWFCPPKKLSHSTSKNRYVICVIPPFQPVTYGSYTRLFAILVPSGTFHHMFIFIPKDSCAIPRQRRQGVLCRRLLASNL